MREGGHSKGPSCKRQGNANDCIPVGLRDMKIARQDMSEFGRYRLPCCLPLKDVSFVFRCLLVWENFVRRGSPWLSQHRKDSTHRRQPARNKERVIERLFVIADPFKLVVGEKEIVQKRKVPL